MPTKNNTHKEKYAKKRGQFLSVSYIPKNLKFENQDDEEKALLLLRRHPLTNIGWIILTAFGFMIPYIIEPLNLLILLPDSYQFVLVAFWYLLVFGYSLEKFLQWYFSVNVVTDERIVDFDFHHITFKQVTDANIDKIQDVTYKVSGVFGTFFNYGDILVQTASEIPNLEFRSVANPEIIADILQDLRIEEEVEKLEGRLR
jgi:hypothetical protein